LSHSGTSVCLEISYLHFKVNKRVFDACVAVILKEYVAKFKCSAIANITLQNLTTTFKTGGEQEIIKLLSTKYDITNKPLVTKNKNVLNKIILFLKNL